MKAIGLYAGLLGLNGLVWAWALIAFHHYPVLLGMAGLAYSLGLRHAVDADHIAAIDNVTRRLMQGGERPLTVGLFFSLGHSTVVVLATIMIALASHAVKGALESLTKIGSVFGTAISAGFLVAIALSNLWILRRQWQLLHRVRAGHAASEEIHSLNLIPGLLGRALRPLFDLLTRSWQMYPLGFLFGLGFDTASEIGVLSLSASQAARGLPIWSMLVFPMLFTAGMSLIDTLDSTLMVSAYGWGLVKPLRKLYYNITVTGISISIALGVASLEALGLLADRLRLFGLPWRNLHAVNENFALIGSVIVGVFLASWLLSLAIHRMRYGEACDGAR